MIFIIIQSLIASSQSSVPKTEYDIRSIYDLWSPSMLYYLSLCLSFITLYYFNLNILKSKVLYCLIYTNLILNIFNIFISNCILRWIVFLKNIVFIAFVYIFIFRYIIYVCGTLFFPSLNVF